MLYARCTTILLVDRVGGGGDVEPWREALATAPEEVRIALVGPEPGWWDDVADSLGLAASDAVLVCDVDAVPGPDLLERMQVCRDEHPGSIVDARTLPVEVTQVQEEPRPKLPVDVVPSSPPPLRVSAACLLLDVATMVGLGEVWQSSSLERGERLAALLEGSGAEVAVEPTASVFLPFRVDADGRPEPTRTEPPSNAPTFVPPVNLHPTALPATSVSTVLSLVGVDWSPATSDEDADRPFLSVVTRTQGRRTLCLEDMFTCLAGQTLRDFEVLLLCHRVSDAERQAVQDVVDGLQPWLRDRVRVMTVERPGRSAPLNEGFAAARGRYVAILDDDDTVTARWVEAFADLERRAPGRLLRTATVRQDVMPLAKHPELCPIPLGNAFADWPSTFELVDHLRANYSPCMSMAFPRGAFHDLGFRFDETLDTTEDWDFLVRVAGIVGAESSPEVTSVYRWWVSTASSRALHDKAEWEGAHRRVLAKIDNSVILLPPGAARRFRETTNEGWDEAATLASSQHQVILELIKTSAAHDQAVENWKAAEQRAAQASARAQKWRDKLVKRTQRFEQRLTLIRKADELVRTGAVPAPATPIAEMSVADLESLVTQGAAGAPPSTPSRIFALRPRRGEKRS